MFTTLQETMITRGVASVKSPVCNLHQYDTSITQETFSQAVVDEFKKEYGIHEEPCYVEENNAIKNLEYIQKGMKELPSWDWLYGQTPEFDYTVNHLFPWADATVKVKSKHGIILSCSIELTDLRPGEEFISSTPSRLSTPTAATISSSSTSESMPTTQQAPTSIPVVPTSASEILAMVKEVGESLEGKRYGFVDFCSGDGGSEVVPELDQQNEDQGVLISPVSPPPPPSSLPLRASSPTSSVTSTHLGKLRRDVEDLLRKVMDMKS
ncbi:hypothetical protein AX16_007781 [Volvariella volvacea WC 439]|nr:hypothetical protein AX16_007781 [Volvariella volvacea WC 439]